MIASSWYPVTQYKLSLGVLDRLYDLVMLIHKKYDISCDEKEYKLLDFLENIENIENVEIEKRIKVPHEHVPYGLLT